MKKVKGITITSLLHNGILYEPRTEIEINVTEKEYEFLKNYIDFSIPQTYSKKEETKTEVKETEKIEKEKDRPNVRMAEANKPSLRTETGKMFKS